MIRPLRRARVQRRWKGARLRDTRMTASASPESMGLRIAACIAASC